MPVAPELRPLLARSPAPATAAAVFTADRVLARAVTGTADLTTGRAVRPGDWWDLASLTKVLVTLPEVLTLVDGAAFGLDTPLAEVLPASPGTATIGDLLSHAAGLPASVPFYREHTGAAAVLRAALRTPPTGGCVYSDLGFMLLGAAVEVHTGRTLADLAAARTGLRFGAPDPGRAVATEHDPWRGRLIVGEVHDENAAAMGGVAGQAGAFGTLDLVIAAAQAWLAGRVVSPALHAAAVTHRTTTGGGDRFGLGWLVAPKHGLGAPGASGFGHTGFVGNRLWLEPERGRGIVVLANRVHPTRHGTAEPFAAWCAELFAALG